MFFLVFLHKPSVYLFNHGSDVSIDNIVWLGLDDIKINNQDAVKKVLELTKK